MISLKIMSIYNKKWHTLPRVFCPQKLTLGQSVDLSNDQSHYLVTVMRRVAGDGVRLFNDQDGEWMATLEKAHKKTAIVVPTKQLRMAEPSKTLHVVFGLIKKHRQDILIEKATELGATDIWPVKTDHGQIQRFNQDRACAQVQEAAEQCERLNVPTVHDLQTLTQLISIWKVSQPLYVGVTRDDAPSLTKVYVPHTEPTIFIGPEGGISDAEMQMLKDKPFVSFFSMGSRVLRAETAAISALAILNEYHHDA